MTEKIETKKFKECPVCKGTNLLCAEMTARAKLAGLGNDNFEFYLANYKGVVADPARMAIVPIGTEMPAINVNVDVCQDCGCIFATQITKGYGKKTLAPLPPKTILPFDPRLHRH